MKILKKHGKKQYQLQVKEKDQFQQSKQQQLQNQQRNYQTQQNQQFFQQQIHSQQKEQQNHLSQNQNQYNDQIISDNSNKGIIYMSRIPPFMTPNEIRKLLHSYNVQRIYLLPETQWVRNNRIKKGGSKRICFREGWIQFTDKRMARMVALSLNGQKMSNKKGSFYSEDIWNLKYLSKFKWHHLTQRLAHEQRLKKERLRLELDQQRKIQQFYSVKVQKSKFINSIVKKKKMKGKQTKNRTMIKIRQQSLLKDQQDQ